MWGGRLRGIRNTVFWKCEANSCVSHSYISFVEFMNYRCMCEIQNKPQRWAHAVNRRCYKMAKVQWLNLEVLVLGITKHQNRK